LLIKIFNAGDDLKLKCKLEWPYGLLWAHAFMILATRLGGWALLSAMVGSYRE